MPSPADTAFEWRAGSDVSVAAWHWQAGDVHALFSTCDGGVSLPPRGTLDVGISCGDDPTAVGENRARLIATAGLEPGSVCSVLQVHGWRCWADGDVDDERDTGNESGAGAPTAPRVPRRVRFDDLPPTEEADALATRMRGRGVAVTVADCVPIAIAAGGAVAVVHAGWRGLTGGVIEQALQQLSDWGTPPTRAAIGPCLGACCFEVAEDVAARFDEAFVSRPDPAPGARPHVDLAAAAASVLTGAGVETDLLDVCTKCDERCFSFRQAEAGITGRQAVLAWRD